MKLVCAPADFDFDLARGDLDVILYGRSDDRTKGSVGAALLQNVRRLRLKPTPRAWDFLSVALSITAADLTVHRDTSSDGWTRDFDLCVAVTDPGFWTSQASTLEKLLQFLTTDRWRLQFLHAGTALEPDGDVVRPSEDCVALLSGGLDSFVGVLDLTTAGRAPIAVSQLVRGDAARQRDLAATAAPGLRHLQLNHNADLPNQETPPSQRARSMVFFAYGVLAATTLARYGQGQGVVLYICENGFITINPPLTGARLGSLSTRTSHPVVLALLQIILDAAGLHVRLENPYRHKTKGEMLSLCLNQLVLRKTAHQTTSCGRFMRFGYEHCGRCLPCLIRRASFRRWGEPDRTLYKYDDLSVDDVKRARSDDVRAAAMAIAEIQMNGLDDWLGMSLSSPLLADETNAFRDVVRRGVDELSDLLGMFGIQ